MFKHFMSFLLALCASIAMAADVDLVIPAAGTGPGGYDSLWATELTLHNAGNDPLTVALSFHTVSGTVSDHSVTLAAKQTTSLDDIVATTFGQSGSITGAITIDAGDVAIGKLAVASRTYNKTPAGEFGQDVPALQVSQALSNGDTGVIPGPSNAIDSRLNFGVYALEGTSIEWRLLRRDGAIATTVTRSYAGGVQVQYSSAVSQFFNVSPEANDTVHAVISGGRAFVYGSIIDRRSGDSTYVPASRTRENLPPLLLGLDVDENGTVDIPDADGDGLLDQPAVISAGTFPSYFRIVVSDPEGKAVTLSLANRPGGARLIDQDGTVEMYPFTSEAGKSDVLIVDASDGLDIAVFRIPLQYR